MVQFGRLPGRPRTPEPEYNPYSLIDLVLNDRPAQARPVEFNTQPANANTVLDREGRPIYPTRCVVQCPQCGAGLQLELPGPVTVPPRVDCLDVTDCPLRRRPVASAVPLPDPFQNPFLEGLMAIGEVDAKLVHALQVPEAQPGTTVAERMGLTLPAGDEP